jgi:hypothetical protein
VLPPTVAPGWRPRSDAWLRRAPSRFAGVPGRPLFIGACPRSGTTLLRVLLDNHPDLAIPHETDFVRPLWWQRARFGDLREEANRRRAAEWIFTEEQHRSGRLRDGRISRRDAIERVARAGPTIGSIAQACLQLRAEADGKPRWGDKRPGYSLFLGPLFAMFPDAQYINLVRDPRGAVASQLPMEWDAPAVAAPAATLRWETAVRRTDQYARRLRPDQILDLRYETLVSDPAGTLERVCAFAGLRAGDAIDTMIEAERGARLGPVHARIAGPVTPDSVERWRERLRPEQIALVEHATARYLDRFGYLPAEALGAAPAPEDLRELARRRRNRRRAWRRGKATDLFRRAMYRRPVAATTSAGPA